MDKNLTDREWIELAASISGEEYNAIAAEKVNTDDTDFLRKAWSDIGKNNIPMDIDVERAWSKVTDRIAKEDEKAKDGFQKPFPEKKTIFWYATRIAAVMLLMVASVWIAISLQKPNTVKVVAGIDRRVTEVMLDDGSRVTLFRGSELTYPKKFNSHFREVILVGEAFFEVSTDKDKPFIVKAGLAEIKVLGTSFNVNAGTDKNEVEVFVESGQVQVTNTLTSEVIVLEKGAMGQLSGSFTRSAINENANVISWNTGILRYNGTELSVVFDDLRKLYDIEISVGSEVIYKNELTTVFENYDEETVIELICTAFNLDYIRVGKSYALSMK